jgi:hypothetical protein
MCMGHMDFDFSELALEERPKTARLIQLSPAALPIICWATGFDVFGKSARRRFHPRKSSSALVN